MRIALVSPEAMDGALQILAAGGVVAHATETCYGLACDLTNPAAVEKPFAMKNRPADQPVSALFPSVQEAQKYVEWNDRAEALARSHLPGPLTLILPLRQDAPPVFPTPYALRPNPTLGLRVSSHPLAMELATRFGKPLSTTSANLHGKPNTYSTVDITEQLQNHKGPDLIIDSGDLPLNPPSTIMDLTTDGTVRRGKI